MKLKPLTPPTDCFVKTFKIPATKVEAANVEQFLTELKASKFAKLPEISLDIPLNLDFSAAPRNIMGRRVIRIHNDADELIREYVASTNGKDLAYAKIYGDATRTCEKPIAIINYSTSYGKTRISNIKELDPFDGRELKRVVYWDGTDKLKGIVTKMGAKNVDVKYLENGTDIDYVLNGGIAIYKK